MGFVKKKNLKINEHTNVTLSATLNDVLNLMVIFIICSLNDCISRLFLCIPCVYIVKIIMGKKFFITKIFPCHIPYKNRISF
jgi:hypothetical protein